MVSVGHSAVWEVRPPGLFIRRWSLEERTEHQMRNTNWSTCAGQVGTSGDSQEQVRPPKWHLGELMGQAVGPVPWEAAALLVSRTAFTKTSCTWSRGHQGPASAGCSRDDPQAQGLLLPFCFPISRSRFGQLWPRTLGWRGFREMVTRLPGGHDSRAVREKEPNLNVLDLTLGSRVGLALAGNTVWHPWRTSHSSWAAHRTLLPPPHAPLIIYL